MFKLPDIPSPRSQPHELADFAEWLAWKQGQVSARAIQAALGRLDDNAHNEGCDDDSDDAADLLDEVMNEIDRRSTASGGGYPFELDDVGTTLRYNPTSDFRGQVYLFLLLTTRMNMLRQRVHAGIDGALLFEKLCALVLMKYLGGQPASSTVRNRTKSFVFGTAQQGSFQQKVSDLCAEIGEGGGFRSRDTGAVNAQDDKLDVVAWTPFSDNRKCKLIIFGQCKTGTSWENQMTQLQPDSFISRWMDEPFVLRPVRAFMITESSDNSQWFGTCLYTGLLFDRCRIVDFSEALPNTIEGEIRKWSEAARLSIAV